MKPHVVLIGGPRDGEVTTVHEGHEIVHKMVHKIKAGVMHLNGKEIGKTLGIYVTKTEYRYLETGELDYWGRRIFRLFTEEEGFPT